MNSQNDNDGASDMNDSVSNYINEARHAEDNESGSDESMEDLNIDLDTDDSDLDDENDLTDDFDEESDEEEIDEGDDFDDEDVEDENSDSDDLDFDDDEDSEDLDEGETGSSHVDEEAIDVADDDGIHDAQEEDFDEMTDIADDDSDDDEIVDDSMDATDEDSGVTVSSGIHEEGGIDVDDEVSDDVESDVENNMQDIISAADNMEEPVKRQRAIKKKSVPKDIIKGINVDLTFETSRQSISLGELSTIKEGYTFVSPNPVNSLIDIRANGRLIGHGRLVNVDGRVGVQITEIL